MIGYVYRITNIQTQKSYIGITEDFERRKRKHIKELKNNIHHSPKLQNAWNYWGENNFEWTVREVQINQYDDLYDIGKCLIEYQSVKIPIYSRERLLVDLIRFRGRIPFDYFDFIIYYFITFYWFAYFLTKSKHSIFTISIFRVV